MILADLQLPDNINQKGYVIIMSKVAVVYWSGTGNTQMMAESVAEGAKSAGAEVTLFTASEFNAGKVAEYDAFAFGCPSMGSEQLEESEFEPMWNDVKDSLGDKKVVLFGSYGWGDGEWMRTWEEESPCKIAETYICNETPGDAEKAACEELGKKLA